MPENEGFIHTASSGESVTSIAESYGFFWQTVWDHDKNAELKQKRKTPNVIAPGDEVFIPPKQKKEESRATEAKHTFKRKGVPAMLRIQLLELDEPRANEPYILEIDGQLISGETDGDGIIEQPISPKARGGILKLPNSGEEWPIRIGHLDPVDTPQGVQQRLNNLGFDAGDETGDLTASATVEALKRFQAKHGLEATGELTSETTAKLEEIHQ